MRIDWDIWTVDDTSGNKIECRKVVDVDTGKTISFVIRGARVEPGSEPDGPDYEAAFDSFSIDGEDPTEAEADEYLDDLRAIVWDVYTES